MLGFDKVFAQCGQDMIRSKYEDRLVPKKQRVQSNAREELVHIVTSAQALGWRESIDTMRLSNNLKATCKRTFVDEGHL